MNHGNLIKVGQHPPESSTNTGLLCLAPKQKDLAGSQCTQGCGTAGTVWLAGHPLATEAVILWDTQGCAAIA